MGRERASERECERRRGRGYKVWIEAEWGGGVEGVRGVGGGGGRVGARS